LWRPRHLGKIAHARALAELIAAAIPAGGCTWSETRPIWENDCDVICLSVVTLWYTLHGHAPTTSPVTEPRARWYTTKTNPPTTT